MTDELLEYLSSQVEGKDVHTCVPNLKGIVLGSYRPDASDALKGFIFSRRLISPEDIRAGTMHPRRPRMRFSRVLLQCAAGEDVPPAISALKRDTDIQNCVKGGLTLIIQAFKCLLGCILI